MEIIIEQQHRVTIVRPTGFVDHETAGALAEALNGQMKAGNLSLVVDLDQLDYMSSAGLRVLLAVLKDARPQGGDLRLANLNEDLQTLFELTKLDTLFQISETRERALESF